MFTIQTEIPLPTPPPIRYTGITYDGTRYFLTNGRECKIFQYGRCFHQECSIATGRGYSSICFDRKEHCFWACSDQCPAAIFKLNSCFQEIDCLHIIVPGYNENLGLITGLSYDCHRDRLVAAFTLCLISVDKSGAGENTLLVKTEGEWILGVLSICPYILCCCVTKNQEQIIKCFSCDGELLERYHIPCANIVKSAVLIPSQDDSQCLHLMVLIARHNCYSCVWDCVVPCGTLEPPVCPCNYWKCEDPPSSCEIPCDETGGSEDFLDSIALLQKAVSHIVTAKGKNLQKKLESSNDLSEILEVNRSVQSSLTQVTYLEHIMYDILSEFEEACCEEKSLS